ncbi:hypothetical protein FRC04_009658 [Tulasnella sp. 424]|nr:hypothetical protein FRC04_009658 [Tulasnella sp. 424]KAG8975956.1 hypothetical protein FRC05_004887 [Tulasnella sp. 425]
MTFTTILLVTLSLLGSTQAQGYTATYTYDPANPSTLPKTSEKGQEGTNRCGTGSNPSSMCQNLFINSITDFCLYGPPYSNGKNATIGETERYEVAYCLKYGYGTRLLPDGTIKGAHWVQTPDYVQVTGWGDFTTIGVPKSDEGGELDPHGADGNGNPIGGLVFGNSYNGTYTQYHEWTNYMSSTEFCIRACKPGPNSRKLCQHIYDEMGFVMPGNYDIGYFDSCLGDTGLPMGIYGTSTFHQGDGHTPAPHPAPASSSCYRVASLTSHSPAPSGASVYSAVTVVGTGTGKYTSLITSVSLANTNTVTVSSTASSRAAGSSPTTSSSRSNGAHRGSVGSIWAGFAVVVGVLAGAITLL